MQDRSSVAPGSGSLLSLRRVTPGSLETRHVAADAAVAPTASEGVETLRQSARLHRRFDRMARLVGDDAIRRLTSSRVTIFGLGGVGSWAAESLVRSGVGALHVVDFDLVCVTNTNRQLHAVKGTTGKPKADVLAQRLRSINPMAEIRSSVTFYDAAHSDALLEDSPHLVIDAIDNITAKAHLIATCKRRGIPIVVSGGASGRTDTTAVRIGDLAQVRDDAFLAATRKFLRRRHDFSDAKHWGIASVYSLEPCAEPHALEYDNGVGFQCVCPQGASDLHGCDHRSVIYGTASYVTGAFGLACASQAVRQLLNSPAAAHANETSPSNTATGTQRAL